MKRVNNEGTDGSVPAPWGEDASAAREPVADACVFASSKEDIAGWIRRMRKARGFTIGQFAEALGVSKPSAWAWENGRAKPRPDRIEAIRRVLGADGNAPVASTGARADPWLVPSQAEDTARAFAAKIARQIIADAWNVDVGSVRFWIEY